MTRVDKDKIDLVIEESKQVETNQSDNKSSNKTGIRCARAQGGMDRRVLAVLLHEEVRATVDVEVGGQRGIIPGLDSEWNALGKFWD